MPVDCRRERKTNPPAPRLATVDRRQILWRTVDVERLIDEDHSARSIWELIGRLDLSLYPAQIESVEGPVVTIPIRSCGSVCACTPTAGEISSAREVARPCEFELGFQWLCGLQRLAIGYSPAFARRTKQGWMTCLCKCLAG